MKTKRPKTKKSNTLVKSKRKILQFEPYFDVLSWKEKPISIIGIEHLGESLIKWATSEKDALILRKFFRQRGIMMDTVERWCGQSPKFHAAIEMAHQALGDRIYEGGLNRKYDSSLVGRGLARYDREWKKLEEWRSNLKKQEQEEKTTTFNINIPQFKGKNDDGSGESV